MKILNLCCGATRPQGEEWYNLDSLRLTLRVGTPERTQLDSEPRYVEHDVEKELPFESDYFDGIVASHCLEHFTAPRAVKIMLECKRALKKNGCFLSSVPDAAYFRANHHRDNPQNAERIFGEPIYLPDGEDTFFGYALWNRWHKTILSYDSLWCYYTRAGFINVMGSPAPEGPRPSPGESAYNKMANLLNRIPFSLIMSGLKP